MSPLAYKTCCKEEEDNLFSTMWDSTGSNELKLQQLKFKVKVVGMEKYNYNRSGFFPFYVLLVSSGITA